MSQRCLECRAPLKDGECTRLSTGQPDDMPCHPGEPSPEAMEVATKLVVQVALTVRGFRIGDVERQTAVTRIVAHALDDFRAEERDDNNAMRLAMIGACSTLDRAHTMHVPGAAKMRDLFRTILASAPKEPRS